jgi:glycosyltransferase involved in cell wall biosynthesis
MNNKISVIIPAYNTEAYLSVTLDSVLAQTHENLEIIVVNDGSTDHTAQVIDAYAQRDSRIIAIHKENGGVTSARLRGIEAATGEYITFVDSDDYIEPHMYRQLLVNAQEHGADISHCGFQILRAGREAQLFHNTGEMIVMDHTTGLSELITGNKVEPGLWNKLYRRSLFEGLAGKMNLEIRIYEDLLMNYYLFEKANVSVFHDICPYHYMIRSGSATQRPLDHHGIYDPLTVRQIIRQNVPEELSILAHCSYVIACMGRYNLILCQQRRGYHKDRKSLRRLLRQEKAALPLLQSKDRLKYWIITYLFWIYNPVYRLAKKLGRNNKY